MRMNVTALGVLLGMCTGWDDMGDLALCYYDFVPEEGISIPAASCLELDFVDGTWATSDDDGNELWTGKLLDLLTNKGTI